MIKIIQNRNKFFILSGILVVLSILALSVWGLNLGIDFTGGSLLEVEITHDEIELTAQELTEIIKTNVYEIGEVRTQPTSDNGFLIRMKDLPEQRHQAVLSVLEHPRTLSESLKHRITEVQESQLENKEIENVEVENNEEVDEEPAITEDTEETTEDAEDEIEIFFNVTEKRFESIGPVIGQELKTKALWAIGIALIIIILYIAWAFKKVSKPVASWKYGIGAIIALAHDVLIVTGVFAVLGHFIGIEVGILFVTALLTILGYSVNDTIVVYDRTRENIIYNPQETFEGTVNKSVNETIGRSINTSLTTLIVLLALYFLGGATIRDFVLTLMIGVVLGTYSSIFVASPLLVVWQKLKRR